MTLPTDPVEAVAQAFAEAPKHRDVADARASIDAESLAMAEAMLAKLTALGWESPEDVALLHAIKDQFAAQARAARAELARVRADVTRLCDEAKHYNQHVHRGPTATDSECVPECRSFAVWTLNPREVKAMLAPNGPESHGDAR